MHVANTDQTIRSYVELFQMQRFLNEDLLQRLQLFTFPAYANVYVEREAMKYLYFLVDGQVQCSHYHLNGKLAVIALSEPFTAIGDVEVMSSERVGSNVIATKPTTMLGVADAAVQQFGANDPRFLRFLIDQLRQKIYNNTTLQTGRVLPVASRLALYILALPTADPQRFATLPDKESLASLLGTTERHLNRVINDLVSLRGIECDYPAVRVRDTEVLHTLIDA